MQISQKFVLFTVQNGALSANENFLNVLWIIMQLYDVKTTQSVTCIRQIESSA